MILDWSCTRTQPIWKPARTLPGSADIHRGQIHATRGSLGRLFICFMPYMDRINRRKRVFVESNALPKTSSQSRGKVIPSIPGQDLERDSPPAHASGTTRARLGLQNRSIKLRSQQNSQCTTQPTTRWGANQISLLYRSSQSLSYLHQVQSLLEKRRRKMHQTDHNLNGCSLQMKRIQS